jgi:hypothetical protein
MSSILDDIDNIINEGDSHVVKTKVFDRVIEDNITNNKPIAYYLEKYHVEITPYYFKGVLSNIIEALKHCKVRDLYKYLNLNELEIRQLCSDKNTIKEVQNCSYSFCIRGNKGQYYNGYFRVNLDNSLTLLKGGTIMIEMEDDLGYFEKDTYHVGKYLVDLLSTPPEIRDYVKKDIENCVVCFTEDFYKELETYCFKKFGLL